MCDVAIFTEQEIAQLGMVIKSTWDMVAADLPPGPHPRETVLEVAVDGDRMRVHCQPEDAPLVERFYALGWDEMIALAPQLLPFERYE